MSEFAIATELLTALIAVLGSLGAIFPKLLSYRNRARELRAFVISLESVASDKKITLDEVKLLLRQGRELAGTKKI